ncbi:MAG: MFS transporter [Thermoplasmataceae archaeon]
MGYLPLLRDRNILHLWLGTTISISGDVIFAVSLNWIVLEITHSLLWVSLSIISFVSPYVLVAPFAGNLVDRSEKVKVMLVGLLIEGLIMSVLSLLYLTGNFVVPIILVGVFTMVSFGQIPSAALNAMLPEIVTADDLGTSNSMFSFAVGVAQLTGFGIGGVILVLFGPIVPITYDALTFFIAVIVIHNMSFRSGPKEEASLSSKFMKQFREGINSLIESKTLIQLLLLNMTIVFFGGMLEPLFVGYASIISGGMASAYGLILSFLTAGAALSSYLLGHTNIRKIAGLLALLNLPIMGLLMIMLGISNYLPISFLLSFLLGASYPLSTVTTSSLVQIKSESGKVGLVSSTFGSLTLVPSIIGLMTAGFLSGYISVQLLFIVPGFVLLIIFFVMFLFLNEVRKAGY